MPHSSSPLNPHRSSSPSAPLSSPTPGQPVTLPLTFSPTPNLFCASASSAQPAASGSRSTTPRPLSSRYTRPLVPNSRRSRGPAAAAVPSPSRAADLFSEGTTPTQGAMWRERLARRMAERERRKRVREGDYARRRGTDAELDLDDDEAERQAQEDDEEMFRRLMVLQRRREQHAALVRLEVETGGSDPNLPDFWEDELDHVAREERALLMRLDGPGWEQSEEERWGDEAAAAEEAELEAEEAAIAEQVEIEMARSAAARAPDVAMSDSYDDYDEDWAAAALEMGDAMDVE